MGKQNTVLLARLCVEESEGFPFPPILGGFSFLSHVVWIYPMNFFELLLCTYFY